jgi:hypothetical protein
MTSPTRKMRPALHGGQIRLEADNGWGRDYFADETWHRWPLRCRTYDLLVPTVLRPAARHLLDATIGDGTVAGTITTTLKVPIPVNTTAQFQAVNFLDPVGRKRLGCQPSGWRSFPHPYSVEQHTIMAWKQLRATT